MSSLQSAGGICESNDIRPCDGSFQCGTIHLRMNLQAVSQKQMRNVTLGNVPQHCTGLVAMEIQGTCNGNTAFFSPLYVAFKCLHWFYFFTVLYILQNLCHSPFEDWSATLRQRKCDRRYSREVKSMTKEGE